MLKSVKVANAGVSFRQPRQEEVWHTNASVLAAASPSHREKRLSYKYRLYLGGCSAEEHEGIFLKEKSTRSGEDTSNTRGASPSVDHPFPIYLKRNTNNANIFFFPFYLRSTKLFYCIFTFQMSM